MNCMNIVRLARRGAGVTLLLWLIGMLSLAHAPLARAAGNTWLVTSATDDVMDGDLAARHGSLRFALAHAVSGDLVQFGDLGESVIQIITANGPLVVPDGVAVGHRREEACGSYHTPLVTIQADYYTGAYGGALLSPVVSLGAGATLRNVEIGGGDVSLKLTGANADVCAVGLGLDAVTDSGVLPPHHAALIVDGDHAVVHRNYINGPVVVTTRGSDTLIGDALGGSGEGNDGIRAASVTVLADPNGAARRVTIRDPFPRGLAGLVGGGVAGGDDLPTHANNWAQTPAITSATTADNFATVQIVGTANPHSLVDVYFDTQVSILRQPPVSADASGHFSFSGALPGSDVQVFAVSTLADAAHTGRVGSSSETSALTSITVGTPPRTLALDPATLTFSAVAGHAAPPAQPLTVTANMPTLAWQTSITTTDGGNWPGSVPASGTGSTVLSVTVDPGILAVGTYHGSISVFDTSQPVISATAAITLVVQSAEPLLAAVGSIADLSSAPIGTAYPGDSARFTMTMTNVGAVDVANIHGMQLMLPVDFAVISGTGVISGAGTGFVVNDSGFSGGTLAPGQVARYTLDLRVAADARPGGRVISMEVGGDGIIGIPVVGRIRINPPLVPRMWLPCMMLQFQ